MNDDDYSGAEEVCRLGIERSRNLAASNEIMWKRNIATNKAKTLFLESLCNLGHCLLQEKADCNGAYDALKTAFQVRNFPGYSVEGDLNYFSPDTLSNYARCLVFKAENGSPERKQMLKQAKKLRKRAIVMQLQYITKKYSAFELLEASEKSDYLADSNAKFLQTRSLDYSNLGDYLLDDGKLLRAEAAYLEALTLIPTSADAEALYEGYQERFDTLQRQLDDYEDDGDIESDSEGEGAAVAVADADVVDDDDDDDDGDDDNESDFNEEEDHDDEDETGFLFPEGDFNTGNERSEGDARKKRSKYEDDDIDAAFGFFGLL